jgi:hypothetical protein
VHCVRRRYSSRYSSRGLVQQLVLWPTWSLCGRVRLLQFEGLGVQEFCGAQRPWTCGALPACCSHMMC